MICSEWVDDYFVGIIEMKRPSFDFGEVEPSSDKIFSTIGFPGSHLSVTHRGSPSMKQSDQASGLHSRFAAACGLVPIAFLCVTIARIIPID
jgi:hypothetical protein